eukprot:m.266876 g.266876  ORF g.266876 m.266876 type:complete len:94 (+) comp40505_c0_seq27:1034-1315(+)
MHAGCSEEELNAHFFHLKDIRNDDVAKWLTPYTGSAEELVLFSLVVFVFLCFCVLSVKVISVEWFAAYARWFWFKAESCMWRHASNDTVFFLR